MWWTIQTLYIRHVISAMTYSQLIYSCIKQSDLYNKGAHMKINTFYQKHQSDILFVIGLMAITILVRYLVLLLDGVLGLVIHNQASHIPQVLSYFILDPIKRLIPFHIVEFGVFGLVTIKTSKSGFGSTIISVCAADLFFSLVGFLAYPFNPPLPAFFILQTTVAFGLLAWLNWKYVELTKYRKLILMVVTIIMYAVYIWLTIR